MFPNPKTFFLSPIWCIPHQQWSDRVQVFRVSFSYQSPSKRFNSVRGCLEPRSPRLIMSPLKRPMLESPLRLSTRRPLESLHSPTANLPNYIKDGKSPLLVSHEKPARKADWLTQLSIEKQKSVPAKPERTKTPKSRKKIGYKS